jgi:hypothetical protein
MRSGPPDLCDRGIAVAIELGRIPLQYSATFVSGPAYVRDGNVNMLDSYR